MTTKILCCWGPFWQTIDVYLEKFTFHKCFFLTLIMKYQQTQTLFANIQTEGWTRGMPSKKQDRTQNYSPP